MLQRFWRIFRHRANASAVEYGIIVALVSLAMVLGVRVMGQSVGLLFATVGGDASSLRLP